MNHSFIRKTVFIAGVVAVLSVTSVYAANVAVDVTASTTVTNIPKDFTTADFALVRPWEFDSIPSFAITSAPVSRDLSVNSLNVQPALKIIDQTPPNKGLAWFYNCDGLTFDYSKSAENRATVVFTGQINPDQPGTGVQCTCTGAACSTTATLPARLVMQ